MQHRILSGSRCNDNDIKQWGSLIARMRFHRIDNYLSCSGYSFFSLNGQNPLMPYSHHPTHTVDITPKIWPMGFYCGSSS